MNKPRLIDAYKLKQAISDWTSNNLYLEDIEYLEAIIDNQPTAYDIDKVVEQLEEKAFEDYYYNESVYEKKYLIWKDKAIAIVKGGLDGSRNDSTSR